MKAHTNQVATDANTIVTIIFALLALAVFYWLYTSIKKIEKLLEEIRDKLDSGKT